MKRFIRWLSSKRAVLTRKAQPVTTAAIESETPAQPLLTTAAAFGPEESLNQLIYNRFHHRCHHPRMPYLDQPWRDKHDRFNVVLNIAPYEIEPYVYLASSIHMYKSVLLDMMAAQPISLADINDIALAIGDLWINKNQGIHAIESPGYVGRRHMYACLTDVKNAWNASIALFMLTLHQQHAKATPDSAAQRQILKTLVLEQLDEQLLRATDAHWPRNRI